MGKQRGIVQPQSHPSTICRTYGVNEDTTIIIFTDLDGTLLDHNSYEWEEAKPALDICKLNHVPVIPVSSKTRAEMDILIHKLGLSSPFISENGGGIFFPKKEADRLPPGTFFAVNLWKCSLGVPYELLVTALGEIREELGWDIQGFSEMNAKEISHLTGLDPDSARLAAMREYDEPFIVKGRKKVDTDTLSEAAKRRGLKISTGGRFYHLHGKYDKGEAVGKLISWYREHHQVLTIALGDSPNDFSMLKQVDTPVLIRSSRDFPGIREMIPGLKITREVGPKGWNSAVLDLLNSLIPVTH